MSSAAYSIRLTQCVCGHAGVEHYDSHDFCTWMLDGTCDCDQFKPAGPEVWQQISAPAGGVEGDA